MAKKLAIKLRKFGRISPITGYKEESIKVGAPVIVETDRGTEFGYIVAFPKGLPKTTASDVRLKKVLRYATDEDLKVSETLDSKEDEAVNLGMNKVKEHELPIKIVNAEYIFDLKRVIFYYKHEEKRKRSPNLKELSKDLATELKARVDMREINPRDEARIFGGLGPCGRTLCCASWLGKPKHVTVKMVKGLGVSISPTKTSGVCGRLMCCFSYEKPKDKEK